LESFFSFSKDKAELLASRLEKINLVLRIAKVSRYRIRNFVLKILFKLRGPVVFCHNTDGLVKGLKTEYKPADLWVFIDSSQRSLKAAIPIAHSVYRK
jgi:hypothetical protein